MKYFMLDIETMGTDSIADDILEIGILELSVVNGFYQPGRAYSRTLFTAQKPKNDWIATNHKELLEKCRKVPMVSANKVRAEILEFFKSCGATGPAMLMGLNLMSLDIPFMVQKGFLCPSTSQDSVTLKGDFHYRIYELRGSINTACEVLGLDEKTMLQRAESAFPDIELPPGKKHEAIYDCFRQTRMINGIIRLLRQGLKHANP
jgi:oligoribonuclease (3'-5' exoribonuclease)